MKLSLFRRLKKDSSQETPCSNFFKKMLRLNPSINLQKREHNINSFNSNLTDKNVNQIKLPIGASYEIKPNMLNEYGFIRILYKSTSYTIYGKGFTGAYFII